MKWSFVVKNNDLDGQHTFLSEKFASLTYESYHFSFSILSPLPLSLFHISSISLEMRF